MAATIGELTLHLWKQRRIQKLISKKDSTLKNTRSLQVGSWNNDGPLKCMAACAPLKLQHALNRKSVKYIVYTQFMAVTTVLK